jgi:hypothetical protein
MNVMAVRIDHIFRLPHAAESQECWATVVRRFPATTRHLRDVDFMSFLGSRNLRVNERLREDVYGLPRPVSVPLDNAVNLSTVRARTRFYGPSSRKNTGRFDALGLCASGNPSH